MKKPKIRINEKYSDGYQLEKKLISLLLTDTSLDSENVPILIVNQPKGEKYEKQK